MSHQRRLFLGGAVAAMTILPAWTVLRALTPADFGAEGEGGDDAAALAKGIRAAAQAQRRFEIPAGVHAIRSNAMTFAGLQRVRIDCAPEARIVDHGRMVTSATGAPKRLPWGIAFDRCGTVHWNGGRIATAGEELRGSSKGFFSAANVAERRPVLGISRSAAAHVGGLTLDGNGGVGIFEDAAALLGARTDPDKSALLALSHAFFRASHCERLEIIDGTLAPERCAREMWTAVACGQVQIRKLRSRSRTSNFASLAKLIRCGEVDIDGIDVVDPGTGSLVDIIAGRFRYANVDVDYPNGKLVDVSHEWGAANAPIRQGLVENCRTTGIGVIDVHGDSTPEEIARAPIGEIVIRNVAALTGARADREHHWFLSLPDAARVFIERCQLRDIALTRGRPRGRTRIDLSQCGLVWSAGGAPPGRALAAASTNSYVNCSFKGEGPGVVIDLTGATGDSRHVFQGCRFENIVLRRRAEASFTDCTFAGARVEDFRGRAA